MLLGESGLGVWTECPEGALRRCRLADSRVRMTNTLGNYSVKTAVSLVSAQCIIRLHRYSFRSGAPHLI